ncbi:MAG TPA: Holliday junction branch migration DNA helicase RuvB [Candidatus Atribacteria bacterium]|nr:Holliday junction branch migration DNA helicase RuvB [Atribacterota bacterium]HOA99797.1 Holliday junction branch migration DNA helicase RuvB [Candidatus Atribacteria bacterium]MDI9607064.1 Holliday junction branch migration DNA helicase RuvB [Atribacterota bacterium]MDY0134741.1 Holliday junction branch migration DNA helicase RuvB [Atribacterota bacterium]HOQ50657.1 Holliday junction branch migration DNA helicase RuvB [Candidatus Atribacteria bacterium]
MKRESVDDFLIRPQSLADFVGQEKVKSNLQVYIQAARSRGEPLDHVLLFGPPGLGKTTLANIIAHEMNTSLRYLSGPTFTRGGDLASVFSTLSAGEVVFIDEIHRLPPPCEEILYGAMEDFALHLVVGKGPGARSIRIQLPLFTLVGATTRVSLLSSPLRNRFGIVEKLDFYQEEEISKIVKRSAQVMGVEIEPGGAEEIAHRSRGTPRIANRLLRRVRDFAQFFGREIIDEEIAKEAFNHLGVDEVGLTDFDRKFLEVLVKHYQGGPVGIENIASALGEDPATLEEVCEPFLLKLGFIARTRRGRIITARGRQYLQKVKEIG